MRAMRLSRMSTSRARWAGSGLRSEHLTQVLGASSRRRRPRVLCHDVPGPPRRAPPTRPRGGASPAQRPRPGHRHGRIFQRAVHATSVDTGSTAATRCPTLSPTMCIAALRAAREQPVDLALLDIRMPGMSGLDVCRELRAVPETVTLTRPCPADLVTAPALVRWHAHEAGRSHK
ncbi:response regulator [Streptomyces xiangluensis]|uniref:Response regulator n=1 Tax=Streptomyces xiangluensis TaxID=2665720 RepID=A0ABV8YIR3_9ACTN